MIREKAKYIYNNLEKFLYAHNFLSSKKLSLPDFLCIGAQKSGTTWLAENLRCHPQVCLPMREKGGESHYFDREFHRSLHYYSKLFMLTDDYIQGEIIPAYSILPIDRIKFIRKIMPNVKLIFLMRNPIDRAWSQAFMNLVSLPQRKFETVNESEFYQHFQSERSLKRGDYLTIVDNWLSVFPQKQLYIGFFEDIINSPQKLMLDIFSHIGVSTDVDWNNFPLNKRILPPKTATKDSGHIGHNRVCTSIPQNFKSYLLEMYSQDLDKLYQRFGHPVTKWKHQNDSINV